MSKEIPFPDYLVPLISYIVDEGERFIRLKSFEPFPDKIISSLFTKKRIKRDIANVVWNAPLIRHRITPNPADDIVTRAYFELIIYFKN